VPSYGKFTDDDGEQHGYMAVGNDELGPTLGKSFKCARCGKRHRISTSRGKDSSGAAVQTTLQFYKCGDGVFLIGINNRKVGK